MTRTKNPARTIREERAKLTREQAAVKAGLSSSTVYLAEKGLISDATACRLAAVYGVTPEELKP